MNRADRRVCHRSRFTARKSCDAEIGNFNCAVFKKHNILRLYIAMNDTLIVRMLECTEDLRYKENSLLIIDHTLLLNVFLESDSVNAFHNDILNSVAVADIVNLNNVRMREHGNSL